MCKTHLKRRTGHHLFKITVWQPRMSAKFVSPECCSKGNRSAQSRQCIQEEESMSPEAATRPPRQERKPGQRTRKPTPESFPRKFSKFARQKFPKFSPGPSETAERSTFSENSRNLRDKNFKTFSFSKFLRQKFQKFPKFSVFEFFACFMSSMAHPQSANSFVVFRSCRAIPLAATFWGEQILPTFWVAKQ